MAKVSVIIPAAGSGRRFGSRENKIFRDLAGKPIVLRTLRLFAGRADVCEVLLVLSQRDLPEARKRFGAVLEEMGVVLVVGGETRSESVRNALEIVDDEADLVCVHDAVRPCVPQALIDAVFAEADRTGAAILGWPVHATLKRVAPDNVIEATVSREGLWEAQTPQVFRTDWLMAAYAGEDATDDASLIEAAGHAVSAVTGDPRNIKITTPADLAVAEAVIHDLE